jgi:hypothetical protein
VGSVFRDLALIAVAAVIVFALVLLVRYTAIGKPLFEFGSAAQPTPLRITQGEGLVVMINNHVVGPVSDGKSSQQEPMSSRP